MGNPMASRALVGTTKVALNPLSWYLTVDGYRMDLAPPLGEVLRQVAEAGFGAVPIDLPASMTVAQYGDLLLGAGLLPAPGYFQGPFSDPAQLPATLERARQSAAQHTQLGLDRVFIAEEFADPARLASPAQGAGYDPARMDIIIENLGAVARVMVEEGVTPCLHQHVGTLIETAEEVDRVLAGVGPELLLFGPDTGHLAWAGADPAEMIGRHAGRVGAIHLKDVHLGVAKEARDAGQDYWQANAHHVWTEPGRGDLDLGAVLEALAGFDGWFVVEVDLADQSTPLQSAVVSRRWCESYLAHRPTAA